jgi:hypothetical protein
MFVHANGHVLDRRPEVLHRAVGPKKDVRFPGYGCAPTNDLTAFVYLHGLAPRAAQRPEVIHDAVVPEKRVTGSVRGGACSDDLLGRIHVGGGAGRSTKGSEIDDLVLSDRKTEQVCGPSWFCWRWRSTGTHHRREDQCAGGATTV